ncbi:MAG: hypothetical protein AB8B53_06830 [Flavobacteriales bacterium]
MIIKHHSALLVLAILGTITVCLQSCIYENEEELFPASDCDVAVVTYSDEITSLLDDNCYVCHSTSEASGGIILDTYEDVQPLADDGILLCVVSHDSGCSQMPKNQPQLPECDILTLKTWIDEGAENN